MLGIAALLGPWAAHLVSGSSSFHYLAGFCLNRLSPARKARTRDGAVASRSAPVTIPARLFVEAGWPTNSPRNKACQAPKDNNQKFISEKRNTWVTAVLRATSPALGVASLAYGSPKNPIPR